MKYMLAVLFILSLLIPTLSQDATTPATAEAVPTVAAGSVTVINNAPDTTPAVTPTAAPSAPEPWFAKYVAGLAALLLVASTFLGTVNKYFEAKAKDASFMTGAELVAGYTPAIAKDAAKAFVKNLIALGGNLQGFLDEATDATPYVVKVHKPDPTAAVLPHDPTSSEV